MSQSAGYAIEETVRFHRIVSEGDLEELQAALQNGAAVNAPGHVGVTALMVALASKDLEKTKLLIRYGADLVKWTPIFGPPDKVDIGWFWSRISWPHQEGHDAADTTSV